MGGTDKRAGEVFHIVDNLSTLVKGARPRVFMVELEPMKTRVFIVIPTVRSLEFLTAWGDEFQECTILIVEDNPQRTISPPRGARGKRILQYDWSSIEEDFGENAWIFPRKNAGIRSYGFWKAYSMGADVIVTLDDDCFPADDGFVQKHLDNLSARAPEAWFSTFPHPGYLYTRGFPYGVRDKKLVVMSHGLWSNKLDLDAKTQKAHPNPNIAPYPPIRQHVPVGYYFPMSSMNLAFVRDVVPLMYFPLMGEDARGNKWGFDRYDDIWAGVFAKKILDHLGLGVVNGSPFVEHKKASNVQANLTKERRGMAANERLWKRVSSVELTQTTVAGCYNELAQTIQFPTTRYFQKLKEAMVVWITLFPN